MENTETLIEAISELEKLKTVERGLNVGSRKESSAEHSWSCILIADILFDFLEEPLDRMKVFEYLLYHDVVEVYAGDAKFNNQEEMKMKKEKEETAFKRIVSFIPNNERFSRIITEYESRETKEAQFAKAIDCIDSCVRNLNDNRKAGENNFSEESIRKKYLPYVSKFKITLKLFEALMGKLVELKRL